MEERKLDPYQLIGFILIALIMTWMLMNQPPVEEAVVENVPSVEKVETPAANQISDSLGRLQNQANYGSFAALVQARTKETLC